MLYKKSLIIIFAVSLALFNCTQKVFADPAKNKTFTVENDQLAIKLNLDNGISIVSIYNKKNHFEHLTALSPLFQYAVDHGKVISSNADNPGKLAGVVVDSKTLTADRKMFTIVCHASTAKAIVFTFKIAIAAGSKNAVVSTSVNNTGLSKLFLTLHLPGISNLTVPGFAADSSRMLGMIPQEIGGVTTLSNGTVMGNAGDKLEELYQPLAALPGAFNVMEVANMYDRDGGGGIFFADMDGDFNKNIAPIQFILSKSKVQGWWSQFLDAGQQKTLSRLAIGVHDNGDYRAAVDFYVAAHKAGWSFPKAPKWFKEAGALWSTNEEGSGGAYELWPKRRDLNTQIKSFTELPDIYEQEAIASGTNIFYLNDYWEGDGKTERYLIKGDYIPRADLGGAQVLKQGIAAIHKKGGKVIVYVEPFIISTESKIGKSMGESWAARDTAGNLWLPWGPNYVMIAPFKPWQDYITAVAKRLVTDYDVDGIFLDSWGWRYNVSYRNAANNKSYTAQEWSRGVHDLADKVLTAVRSVKPDAVVLSESGGGQMPLHEHGGSTADFVWGAYGNEGRIIASPVRYGMPEVNFFSNGKNLNQTIQVYAAGHQLALNYKWTESAPFIKQLLDIRRKYKDAMIYGRHTYQPATGTMKVGAYFYKGALSNVITVANVTGDTQNITLKLSGSPANTVWTDVLTGQKFTASGQSVKLSIEGSESKNHGLMVLVQK